MILFEKKQLKKLNKEILKTTLYFLLESKLKNVTRLSYTTYNQWQKRMRNRNYDNFFKAMSVGKVIFNKNKTIFNVKQQSSEAGEIGCEQKIFFTNQSRVSTYNWPIMTGKNHNKFFLFFLGGGEIKIFGNCKVDQ